MCSIASRLTVQLVLRVNIIVSLLKYFAMTVTNDDIIILFGCEEVGTLLFHLERCTRILGLVDTRMSGYC